MIRAYVVLLSLLLVPAVASAGLVSPGESITLSSGDFAGPAGTLLAEKTMPFALDYGADPDVGFDGMLNGTLRSAVYNIGGKLAFFYDVDLDLANFTNGATEQSEIRAQSFAGFQTSVSGKIDFEEVIHATRSVDGSLIALLSDSPGLGGPPALLLETDAAAYDENGVISFFAADEIATVDGIRRGVGSIVIRGTYQPILESAPPPTAIPLPPAAYSGFGVLLTMGMMIAYRRWHQGRLLA